MIPSHHGGHTAGPSRAGAVTRRDSYPTMAARPGHQDRDRLRLAAAAVHASASAAGPVTWACSHRTNSSSVNLMIRVRVRSAAVPIGRTAAARKEVGPAGPARGVKRENYPHLHLELIRACGCSAIPRLAETPTLN